MAGDVFRLQGVIGLDISGLESGMRRADGLVSGFGSTMSSVAGTIGTAFVGAAVAGIAGLAAGIGTATTQASAFERTLSGVSAVTGATAREMKTLSDLALKLGADTSFSATEAAQGIEELSKAGVSIADIMGGAAKASLDLAAAGEISVADAATVASNAMNQFGLKGSDMAHVADLIAGAANASAIDVGQFKFSLQAAGAVAATVGFSFDDLASAIAVMGQAGITGSDAGTSLKSMMMGLQPQTDKQVKLFRDLGLMTESGANAFFDATGKVKSMAEVSQVLQDALRGQTEQQKLATLETLFGSDAIRAGAVMAKNGAAGFNEMAAAMGKVSAADVASERLNNLSGSMEKLKGTLSTIAITIGLGLTPHLKKLVDWGTDILNGWMPTITAFADQLPGAIDATVATLTGPLNTTLVWLTGTGFPLLEGAFAIVAAYVTGVFIPSIMAAWTWLSPKLSAALSWLTTTGFPLMLGAIQTAGGWIQTTGIPILMRFWDWLLEKIGAALTWLSATGWPMLKNAVSSVTSWLLGTAVPTLMRVWEWLSPKLQAALNWLVVSGWPMLQTAAATFTTWLGATAVPALIGVWEWLSPKIGAALSWLSSTAWPLLQTAAATVMTWVTGTAIPTLTVWWDWLSPKIGATLTWLATTGWPALQAAGSIVATWLSGTLFPALSEWYVWFQDRLSPIYTWFKTTGWPALQSAGATVWTWMTGSLFPSLREWYEWLQDRLSPIYTWFTTTGWPRLQAAGAVVWTWLSGTLFPVLREWYTWFQDRLSPIYSWFIDYAWPKLLEAGSEMWTWMTTSLFPTLREWWVWFQDRLAPIFNWFVDYGWPMLLEKAKAYGDYVLGDLIRGTKELNDELRKTDAAESWVTILENLGKFGHYLITSIDLGGWFKKIGSGAGEAGSQVGYIAQAIAWISRTLAKWSSFLPGAGAPNIDPLPSAPGGGGGGGGGAGGGANIAPPPTRTGGGGGLFPTQPPGSIAPGPGGGGAPPATAPGGGGGTGGMPTDAAGWRDLTRMMAGEYGLGEWFVNQIKQESNFDPTALSGAGARGIAQFMPGTGAAVAAQLGVSTAAFWADPRLQLRGGAHHMRDLLNMMGGNVIKALVGYNAGSRDAMTLTPGREIWELENIWRDKQPREYIRKILGLADGGIVRARPGGMPAVIGEGGRDEAVIPLPQGWRAGRGGTGGGDTYVTIDARGAVVYDGSKFEDMLVRSLEKAGARGRIVKVTR